ncbi:MAG: type II toxin-antitoxin system VapC family toxin [Chloroflexota bacterium]
MNVAVTIDASVFVNAFSPTEEGSQHSWDFLSGLKENNTPIIVPTLLLAEVVASIARRQDNNELALEWLQEIKRVPNITFVDLDQSLAESSAEIAAAYRLRGSDAVYAAVAKRFATELVTLDREQLERVKKAITVRKP